MKKPDNKDERTVSGSLPPSVSPDIIELGQVVVQKGYRIAIREICENNGIQEGDIVVVYIKKTKAKSKKK
jgi:hypothetical protein